MRLLLLFFAYVLLSAYGLYLLKLSTSHLDPGFILGIILYGGGFIVWLYLLRTYPLSYIFPVAAGSLILATSVLGIVSLDESLSVTKIAGIILIIAGIYLLTVTRSI